MSKIVQAFHTDAIIEPNGELRLRMLPYQSGDLVEVIVLPRLPERYPTSDDIFGEHELKDSVLRYDAPTEPVVIDSWETLQTFKIIIEKHSDGYVAYPIGLKGAVVGEGDSYDEALADVRSAIRFHIETFGPDVIEDDDLAEEVFLAEMGIAI
jgi:predicted RNase H-like HicB family nuclease